MLNPDTNSTCDRGNDGPSPAPFVSTENLSDPAIRDLLSETVSNVARNSQVDAAYAACRAIGGGQGFFRNWKEKLDELLLPTYRLLCEVHNDPGQIARIAAESDIEPTKAARRNPALICMTIGARPTNTDQRKLCSDWSMLLRSALAESTPVEGFVAFVERTSIRDCKAAIAKQKRAAKLAAGLPSVEPRSSSPAVAEPDHAREEGSPRLELRLHGVDGTTGETVELPASIHGTVMDALTTPGSQIERLERLAASLQALARELTLGTGTGDPRPDGGEPEVDEATAEASDV